MKDVWEFGFLFTFPLCTGPGPVMRSPVESGFEIQIKTSFDRSELPETIT